MSALSIAQETLSQKIPPKFLELLVDKFSGEEFTRDDIFSDGDLAKYLTSSRRKTKSSSKSPEDLMNRAKADIDENKCQARVWAGGYGGQCTRKHLDDGCLCTLHKKVKDEHGSLWLGMISSMRPEDPVNPKNGKVHQWLISDGGKDRIKKKSPQKKPVEKKKKPVEKKKPSPSSSVPKQGSDLSLEELKALMNAKLKENPLSNIHTQYETKVFEGIEYKYDLERNIILDPDDNSEVGTWDDENDSIIWDDEDCERKHEERM